MFSMKDIQRIRDWALTHNYKVAFYFERHPYTLVINRVIHARDASNNITEWTKAFGSKLPQHVLSTFRLKRIVVYRKDTEILFFNNINKFMSFILRRRYT